MKIAITGDDRRIFRIVTPPNYRHTHLCEINDEQFLRDYERISTQWWQLQDQLTKLYY